MESSTSMKNLKMTAQAKEWSDLIAEVKDSSWELKEAHNLGDRGEDSIKSEIAAAKRYKEAIAALDRWLE